MEEMKERRAHKRFKANEDTFIVAKNGSSKLGTIKDISKGGLALRYIVNGDYLPESFWVDIFNRAENFYLKNIPAKKIFDVNIYGKVPFSTLIQKQVGVQFGDMEHDQMDQLDYFINNHTITA